MRPQTIAAKKRGDAIKSAPMKTWLKITCPIGKMIPNPLNTRKR